MTEATTYIALPDFLAQVPLLWSLAAVAGAGLLLGLLIQYLIGRGKQTRLEAEIAIRDALIKKQGADGAWGYRGSPGAARTTSGAAGPPRTSTGAPAPTLSQYRCREDRNIDSNV